MSDNKAGDLDAYLASEDDRYEGSRDTDDGIIISTDPDYCYSPNKIVPYTIFAKQSDDAGTAATVRMTGKRAHTSASLITRCYGDEAGIGGGIDSGTHNGICRPKSWSNKVFIEGHHAVRDSDEWFMNNGNTTGILSFKVRPQHEDLPQEQADDEEVAAEAVEPSEDGMPLTNASMAAAPPLDGYGNLQGAIEYHKFRESFKNWQPTGHPLTEAARAAKLATGMGVFLGTLFAMKPSYRGALADQWVSHRGLNPGFDTLYQDALDDWERLDGLGYEAGEQWFEHWNRALITYQEQALIGKFGPTQQTLSEMAIAGTTPPQLKERFNRDRLIVTGAAALAAAVEACQHLACPLPVGRYHGGAHWCTSQPVGDGLDSHHMPAQGYGNTFPPHFGPAIQMTPADHRMTASNPSSRRLGKDYNKQAAHLAVGQNFAAFRLDVIDIKTVELEIGHLGKYDAAVAQAEAYMNCLKAKKLVQ